MSEPNRILVEPAAAAYVGVIKHPIDGPLKKDGSLWTYDGFTCRMLVDGVIFKAAECTAAEPAATESDPIAPAEAETPAH